MVIIQSGISNRRASSNGEGKGQHDHLEEVKDKVTPVMCEKDYITTCHIYIGIYYLDIL